jgi:YgiT-type zinc finger domain-containing protein
MRKCVICGGKTGHSVDIPTELKDKFLIIKGILADVCTQCGEIYYLDVAKKLGKIEDNVSEEGITLVRAKNVYEVEVPLPC